MSWFRVLVPVLVASLFASVDASAEKKTVCTITVNSPDEKQTFERNLPASDYQFVELVKHGNPNWLASACHSDVRCDVLLISGHFDGGTDFYSDRVDVRESLSVEELEHASCSSSCPGLFSQLKEVYLFGCNTLNAEALHSASAEVKRSLVRSGHSPADADRLARALQEVHGESNRDRMRHIFKDVPAIYGFSSKAPLGVYAGPVLEHYFQSGDATGIGTGHPSSKLVGLFAPVSMTSTSGVSDSEPQAAHRRDVCELADDRESIEQKLAHLHEFLAREPAEVRMLLDRIEHYVASLGDQDRRQPAAEKALADIASDRAARARFLDFARDADEPAVRMRMLEVARAQNWLTPTEKHAELVRMIVEALNANVADPAVVDRACAMSRDRELTEAFQQVRLPPAYADNVTHAAMLACLGRTDSRGRILSALSSGDDADAQVAQVYLGHRPIADAAEFRHVATGVARMPGSTAQVRALDTLARQPPGDADSMRVLTDLFRLTKSIEVQRAIAGILIRADYKTIASPELVASLRKHRIKSPAGDDVIDVLIKRLEAH